MSELGEHFIETKLLSRKADFPPRLAVVSSFHAVPKALEPSDVSAVAVRLPRSAWGDELETLQRSLKGRDIGLAFDEDEELDIRRHANGLVVHDNLNFLTASPSQSFRALGAKLVRQKVSSTQHPFNRLAGIVGMMCQTVAQLNRARQIEARFLRDFKPGYSVADDIGFHFDENYVAMMGLHGRNVLSVTDPAEKVDRFIQQVAEGSLTIAELPLGMPLFAKGLRSDNPHLHAGARRVGPEPIDRASIVVSAESVRHRPPCTDPAVQRVCDFVNIKNGGARRFTQLLTRSQG